MRRSGPTASVLLAWCLLVASDGAPLRAQSTEPQTGRDDAAQAQAPVAAPLPVYVKVVGTTPLPGVDAPATDVPAPVQTVTAAEIERSGTIDLADFVNRRLGSVYVNELQGNPFQPDVSYRGYTASPLLGTPQGLSVYMDGVRLNQPFGDVVSWDLIPRIAIASTTLVPGSNPLFGLNTLGGALSLRSKGGDTNPGTSVVASYGSHVRRLLEFEHGGARSNRLHWYLAGTLFGDDGWRDASPSEVHQFFGKLGWSAGPALQGSVAGAYADNLLHGNGLQETRLLDRAYDSVYTTPDETDDRSTMINLGLTRLLGTRAVASGAVNYLSVYTGTLNGDVNEDSLDQDLYQPTAVERAALAAAGYTGYPLAGANAANTPFPSWRCVANVLLNDEPAAMCNALVNRTRTDQHSVGASGQVTAHAATLDNRVTIGGGYDRSRAAFTQSTELGYLDPHRGAVGQNAFADGGVTGGSLDGEPFDARVDLDGLVQTWSLFATDTFTPAPAWRVTVSGRYNHTSVRNRDGIAPGGGPSSLDGDHEFARLNPAAGVTFNAAAGLNLYAGYSEGSRAATSIELGCANPEQPCKLPNAMAGDPPLQQVVTRTVEAGVRGQHGAVSWNAGVFRAANRDDIQFVTSERTGFGYFTNVDHTLRQGVEFGARWQERGADIGGSYTLLDATFESDESFNGAGNSSNDAAGDGFPGLEGRIEVQPGDRIPLVPRHMLKAFADIPVTAKLTLGADVQALSGSFARGNENNDHAPDGVYYLGPGATSAYAVVNLGARYAVRPWLQILAQVNNLFDQQFSSASQLGPAAFTPEGAFVAQPYGIVNGTVPVTHSTFYAPGAPLRVWAGLRLRFNGRP